MRLLLATRNRGKTAEIAAILQGTGVQVLSLDDVPGEPPEVVEDGATFEDNAGKKALAVARWAGMPALADDSGLVVPALGGEPGVHSSRYAGREGDSEANMDLLLERMADLPTSRRAAHFECVMALASPDGRTWTSRGRVDRIIATGKAGKGGFGYDPVFFYTLAGKTFAQMDIQEKNRVSHRSRALKALAGRWPEIMEELGRGSEATSGKRL
ncbi:MAG: XTP/dITP diphosphatase [bacterium]|nr:MAG: XTP/dITP diphosphatase [bacterium]